VLLWNSDVVDFEFEGIRSSRSTQGHRFLHQDGVTVDRPEKYKDCLRESFVLVDPEERRSKIRRELEASLKPGLCVAADDELFEMVCNLNEFPSVLRGCFDKQFLNLPQEVLVTVMRHHQKYFSVVDAQGAIQPLFLTVVDTSGDPEGVIRKGHERVLKARLEDAAFFWKNDQNRSLDERYKSLDQVLFQNNLGTYFDKTQRIRAICRHLNQNADLDAAARLCKADLTTEMVFEMPELQGVMGGLYAREAGHPEAVWKAIYEHYRPQSMEDDVPETLHGALLSLSDKLDTIVGCFGMGVIPKGSRDPFALRRQAQGLVRILLEHRLDFTLPDLVELAEAGFEATRFQPGGRAGILDFLCQRVVFVCREQGISYDVMNAVAAVGMDQVFRTYQRATALQEIRRQVDFEALAIAFKRVKNILSNQEFEKTPVVEQDLEDQSEQKLYRDLKQMKPEVRKALDESDYLGALKRIARLRRPVDAFFEEVLVLTEDARLRNNRLRLLHDISELFLEIADISEIVSPAR
jgi:glycyl-tRNA synthetase beta chain